MPIFNLLIFLLVEEKVVFGRIVRPDVLDRFVDLAGIFELLQIINNFEWSATAGCVVNQFFFCCRPWSFFKPVC